MKWIKEYGQRIESIRRAEGNIDIIEMDEMHSYLIWEKNYCWIWMAVNWIGKRVVSIILGTCGRETEVKLWDKLSNWSIQQVKTDYWKAYREFVLSDIHHQ